MRTKIWIIHLQLLDIKCTIGGLILKNVAIHLHLLQNDNDRLWVLYPVSWLFFYYPLPIAFTMFQSHTQKWTQGIHILILVYPKEIYANKKQICSFLGPPWTQMKDTNLSHPSSNTTPYDAWDDYNLTKCKALDNFLRQTLHKQHCEFTIPPKNYKEWQIMWG